MTHDQAVEFVRNGVVPLESVLVDGTGGLKEIATALGMTVPSRPAKPKLITDIRNTVAAIPVTPAPPRRRRTPTPAEAAIAAATTPAASTPTEQPATGNVEAFDTPKRKSKLEESADRIFRFLRK